MIFILLLDRNEINLCLPHSYLNVCRHSMPVAQVDPGINRINVPDTSCGFNDIDNAAVVSCNAFKEF